MLECRTLLLMGALLASGQALAETVTKNVNYNGTPMEMTLSDHTVEVKNGDVLFLRGTWDSAEDYFAGEVFGNCPFQIRGTVDYNGIFVAFGYQQACENEAAHWRTMRFIPPPQKISRETRPKPKAQKTEAPKKKAKPRQQRRAPSTAPAYPQQQQFWQWNWGR